jgi:hypothetical protein
VSFTQVSYVGEAWKQYAGYFWYGRAVECVDMSYCVGDACGGTKPSRTRRGQNGEYAFT